MELEIPSNCSPEHIYKLVLPYLIENDFLSVLEDKIGFREFHEKLIKLSSLPHGVGLGVSLMAQVNIAGQVLKILCKQENQIAKNLLKSLVKGENIISLGVSEKGWKGKISNTKTEIFQEGHTYYLSGEKAFFTNGGSSTSFLVVAKWKESYAIAHIHNNQNGVRVQPFHLSFAKEATHCSMQLDKVEIAEENLFPIDYSNYSENLRFSEMLSLCAIFVGYSQKLLSDLKSRYVDSIKSRNLEIEILKLESFIQFFKARVLEISFEKDKNPDLKLKAFFPFGLEFIIEHYYSKLNQIFSEETIHSLDIEKDLFTFRDPMNELYIKKAALKNLR